MPIIGMPKGTPAPGVADFAGMPMEAVEGAVAKPLQGLINAARPYADEAKGVADGIFSPISKAIQSMRNAYQPGGEQLSHLGEAMQAEPYASVTRQPKAGGVLHDVLSRAADAQGAGQDVSPGSQRLLNHYMGLIR